MGDKHGPNRLTNYYETHETIMGQFASRGFVLENTLVLNPIGAGVLTLSGVVSCSGGIVLDVLKILRVEGVDGDAVVQTMVYNYNARLKGIGNILRYDSPHEDHNRFHHVHRFTVFDGDHDGWVGQCEWPTLGDVITELEAWFYQHYERLTT